MLNKILKVVPLILLPFQSLANEPDMAKNLNAFIQQMQQQNIFNGSVAIIENGELIYSNSVGYTNFDKVSRLSKDSVFNIGSISKDFTAMSVLLLLDENKLTLKDPLSLYFPQLPDWADKVEIAHLLSHSSGLPDAGYKEGLQNDQLIAELQKVAQLTFSPGAETLYGSYGYQLLAMIVEKVSKQSFGDFVKKRIFMPLNMKSSYVLGTQPDNAVQLAMAYEFGSENIPQDYTLGAGNIYSNAVDLLKWDRALFNHSLVKGATLQQALKPFKCWGNDCRLSADFGIGVYENNQLVGIHHHGGFGGYQSMLYRFPNKNRAIAFTANNGLELQYNDIRFSLMAILDGEPPVYPKKDAHIVFYDKLVNKGFEDAKSAYLAISKKPDIYDVNEKDMNSIGYYLLSTNKLELALSTFKFCSEQFPDSANIWDSYGEALEKSKDLKAAILVYKRGLKLATAAKNEELVKSIEKSLLRVTSLPDKVDK